MRLKYLMMFLLLSGVNAGLKAAPLTGKAKVNADYTEITLTVIAQDVEQSAYDPVTKAWDSLTIQLGGWSSHREDSSPEKPENSRHIWLPVSDPVFQITHGSLGSLEMNVSLKDNPASTDTSKTIKKLQEVHKKLEMEVNFNGTKIPVTAEVVFGRPTKAPEGLRSESRHLAVLAMWDGNKEVLNSKNRNEVPSNVLLMLFDAEDSNLDIKATRVDSNPDSKDEARSEIICKYEPGKQCIRCDEAEGKPVFLNPKQGDQPAFKFQLVSNKTGDPSHEFQKLNPDKRYYLAAQYEEGLERSACIEVKAGRTLSLTEANGEETGTDFRDVRCFIATAAYGSPFHRYVEDFRWFRSALLLKTDWGRRLVSYYYQKSPEYAAIIRASPALRSVTRGVLFLPAMGVAGLRYADTHPWVIWLSLTLLSLTSCFFLRKKLLSRPR